MGSMSGPGRGSSRPRAVTRRDFLRRSAGGAVGLSAASLLWGPFGQPRGDRARRTEQQQPDIVVILTDDQRWDTLWAMPTVQSELVGKGLSFTQSFAVNPLCSPSRASILTGLYSHHTGVYTNSLPNGGFQAFDDSSTVATWLQDAGYRTGLFGKYLNAYMGAYVPPGWTRWCAITNQDTGGAYYRYDLNVDGTIVHHGNNPEDYSTDVLANEAESFVRGASPSDSLFVYFAPYAPHVPSTPAPQYEGAFSGLPPYSAPNSNEADVSDKPAYIRTLPPLTPAGEAIVQSGREDQYETLLSVDDAIAGLLSALEDTGRLANTMVVFASDNGANWDEHRWQGKQAPYEECIRVPLVVRYDPVITSPRQDDHLVLNIDLAPTMAELAGAAAPPTDGVSVIPLVTGMEPVWRSDFAVEHVQDDNRPVPTFCMVRSGSIAYVAYDTYEEELYDLAADPYQLQNVAGDPARFPLLATLRQRAVELCSPLPPGFDFPLAQLMAAAAGDGGFTPPALSPSLGAVETWTFEGTSDHSVTDSSVLGLFDSGPLGAGAVYELALPGASTYKFKCSLHTQHTGSVNVAPMVVPTTGQALTPFVIIWATTAAKPAFRYDVVVKRPGASEFVAWKWGQVKGQAPFSPDGGSGTYQFKARLRRYSDGKSLPWSPAVSIQVT
jgi:N-acetylglucosamine-6-sulfatase